MLTSWEISSAAVLHGVTRSHPALFDALALLVASAPATQDATDAYSRPVAEAARPPAGMICYRAAIPSQAPVADFAEWFSRILGELVAMFSPGPDQKVVAQDPAIAGRRK